MNPDSPQDPQNRINRDTELGAQESALDIDSWNEWLVVDEDLGFYIPVPDIKLESLRAKSEDMAARFFDLNYWNIPTNKRRHN